MRAVIRWFVAGVLAAVAAGAAAQAFPAKPIRMLVAYAAGGGTDILARVIAQGMSDDLGQPVMVENKPGAGSQLATDILAKASPDGYTIMMATIAHSINPGLYPKLPYDSLNDFAPVSLVASVPLIILVSPTVPANNVKELVALAKANPGKLNNAMATGSMPHLAGEMFKKMAGIEVVPVAFKGNSPAYPDLMAGRVQFMFDALSAGLPQVQAGKLKGIAVTSAQRSQAAPDIPTVAESGLPGFEADAWYGVLAPAKTPAAVVDRLNAAIRKAVAAPAIRDKLVSLGYTIKVDSPAEFTAYIRSETDKWTKVVKESGATPE
ncbi:MAG: tripartite tricarboxylate transporter substrate binding protein [Burkholderiales bacterium]